MLSNSVERAARLGLGPPGMVAAALFLLVLAGAPVASAQAKTTSRTSQAGNAGTPPCPPLRGFYRHHHFPDPSTINNPYFPLVPGTQFVYEGQANRGGGAAAHTVTFTVTDLTKVVKGVRSQVVWDVDVNEGQVVEAELAFFAQDDHRNVWTVGEYPEEYEAGTFVGAPSTWFAGVAGSQAGVLVPGKPRTKRARRLFSQGFAPAVEFLDCATVIPRKQFGSRRTICVPAGCYSNILKIHESSPLDPQGGIQVKYYAPGVGLVKIGAINDPEGETLLLTKIAHLGPDALLAARNEALKLEQRAYQVSPAYRRYPPLVAPGG